MSLHVQVFGPPRILRAGQPVTFDTRKAVALVAYLAVTGTHHRRERLAGLLWPSAETSRARATLRRTLSVAGAVGPSLRVAGQEVWLEDYSCDVVEFRQLARSPEAADQHRAAALAVEPFMAGFNVRDSVEFDEWQAGTADQLRDQLAGVLGRLVAAAGAAGDSVGAVAHARRRLALDTLSELAHRDVMLALAHSGDRAGALRQYRSLIRTLNRELGVPPLPATSALADAIRRDELPPWPDAVAADGAGSGAGPGRGDASSVAGGQATSAPVLLDRDDVIADLLASWRRSADGPQVCAVTGDPGIGRTAVLTAVAAAARDAGAVVLSVCGRESERDLGLGALADLLAPLFTAIPPIPPAMLHDLVGLVPPALAGSPTDDPMGPAAERRRVLAVCDLLATTQASAPTLLVIDDAHFLDATSAQVLGYVLARLPGGVCAVVAWPSDRASTALPRAVLALEDAQVMRLQGLSVNAVAHLAGLDHPVRAGQVWERTRGVPRLVVEYLAAVDGVPDAVAQDVRALVAARLDRLSPQAQQVVTAAAVLGVPADPDVLRAASGRDEAETVDAIEAAMRDGLLVEVGSGYDLPYDAARELVVDSTSYARRRLLHRRVAEHLAHARRVRPAVVARHFSEAGAEVEAEEWHWRAAQEALAIRAHDEALTHLGLAGAGPLVARATGEVLVRLGRYDEAIAAFETALAGNAPDPTVAAEVEHRLADVHDRLGEWQAADEHLLAAEALLGEGATPLHARVTVDRALSRYRLGDAATARTLAERVRVTQVGGAERARAENVLGMLDLSQGQPEAGLTRFNEAARVAGDCGAAAVQVASMHNVSRALQALGRMDESLAAATDAAALAEREGDVHRLAAVESHLADLLHAMGRDEEARAVQARSARALSQVALPAQRPEVWLIAEW